MFVEEGGHKQSNKVVNEGERGFKNHQKVETYAAKIRLEFWFTMCIILNVHLFCICILKVHTLTIPKW